ncbi:MAG: alanine racemase [Rickettsiales bacterium]|nr:alanine racemase [Rickettsiales bacterium]
MPHANVATLHVDLPALIANYQLLSARHAKGQCAAVVKANAYGLGLKEVSLALWNADCRKFFVATLGEAIELRGYLPNANIAVFQGPLPKEEQDYLAHQLTPVINHRKQLEHYTERFDHLPAILHVDTGMTRLGLTHSELKMVAADLPATIAMVMSHLACGPTEQHSKNQEQLRRFQDALALLPGIKASLANSAGLFLSSDFHFDLGRPGCALYGINPTESTNPMKHVATLSAPILQVRSLDRDETIGYDATSSLPNGSRIAITALGYADGYFRSQSNKGYATIAGKKVPIIGRVSMDMIALDVSHLPESDLHASSRAEFINAEQPVDALAQACGTIGYEIFTRIGRRVQRVYRPL